MIPLIVAGGGIIIGAISKICGTARDMAADRLITEKELAEIEAKSKAFKQMIEFQQNTIDKLFELELASIDFAKKYFQLIDKLTDRILEIPDNSPKLLIYSNAIDKNLESLNAFIQGDAKYFNQLNISNNNIQLTNFDNPTQVGYNSTNYDGENKVNDNIGTITQHLLPSKKIK